MPKMKKIQKAYLGRAVRQPTETDTEFEIRHEYHTPFKGPQKANDGKIIKITPKQRLENLKKEKEKIQEEENIREDYDNFNRAQDYLQQEDDFEMFKKFRKSLMERKKGILIKKGGMIIGRGKDYIKDLI